MYLGNIFLSFVAFYPYACYILAALDADNLFTLFCIFLCGKKVSFENVSEQKSSTCHKDYKTFKITYVSPYQ